MEHNERCRDLRVNEYTALVKAVAPRLNWRTSKMCDYSLHGVNSRPAKVKDRLATTQFRNTITSGFSEIGKSNYKPILAGSAVASRREGHRSQRSGRAGQLRRWGRALTSANRYRAFFESHAPI